MLVDSSSSTQAIMKRGNWKNDERHIFCCLLEETVVFSDRVDEKLGGQLEERVDVEQDQEHDFLDLPFGEYPYPHTCTFRPRASRGRQRGK